MEAPPAARMPGWLAAFLDLLLDLLGLIMVGLVLLPSFCAIPLEFVGSSLGSFIFGMWCEYMHTPRDCWNQMVCIPPDPTVPEPLPPKEPRKMPRPRMTEEQEAAHIAWIKQSEELIVYTPQEPVKRTSAEIKAEILRNHREAEQQKAAARAKQQEEFEARNPGLVSRFSEEHMQKKYQEFFTGMEKARQIWSDPRERIIKPRPFSEKYDFPLIKQQCSYFSESYTSSSRQAQLEATQEWIQEIVEKRQSSREPQSSGAGSTDTEGTGAKRAKESSISDCRKLVKATLEPLLNLFKVFDPGAEDPLATMTPAMNESTFCTTCENLANFISQLCGWVAPDNAWDINKIDLATAAELHMGPDDQGLWHLMTKIKTLQARAPTCMEIVDAATALDRLWNACGAPKIAAVDSQGGTRMQRITPPDPKSAPTSGQSTTFTFGSTNDGAGAQIPENTPSANQAGPSAGASSEQTPAPVQNPIVLESTLEKQRIFVGIWINWLRTTIADGNQGTVDSMSAAELKATLNEATQRLTFIRNWCAPDDQWRDRRVNKEEAEGINLTKSDLEGANMKLISLGLRPDVPSEDIGPCVAAMGELIKMIQATFPESDPHDSYVKVAENGAGNPAADKSSSNTAGSSSTTAPPANPILTTQKQSDKVGLVTFYTTEMLRKFNKDRVVSIDYLNADFKLMSKYLTWITGWTSTDGKWNDNMSAAEARAAKVIQDAWIDPLKHINAIWKERKGGRKGLDENAAMDAYDKLKDFAKRCKYRN